MDKTQKENLVKRFKDYTDCEWNSSNESLSTVIELLDEQVKLINQLEIQLAQSNSKSMRKLQVLEILKEHDSISIQDIANKLGISSKNVSSQLTYLRSDGYKIFTDHNGKKVLMP